MKTVECRTCAEKKSVDEYYLTNGKPRGRQCKICFKAKMRETYRRNKEKTKKIVEKKACSLCEKVKHATMFDINNNYEDCRARMCKQCVNAKRRERYSKIPKEEISKRNAERKWYITLWMRTKRKEDIEFRLRCRISTSVWQAIKKSGGRGKGGSTFKHLPYTPKQLKEHLESQFEDWMSWDNYGEWHIDHIYPQSKTPYDSLEHPNFQKCWALSNLQPLSAKENFSKGDSILSEGDI